MTVRAFNRGKKQQSNTCEFKRSRMWFQLLITMLTLGGVFMHPFSECSWCERTWTTTDCSNSRLDKLPNLPQSCTATTSTINLNGNMFTKVPVFDILRWPNLRVVLMLANPLDCENVCNYDTHELVSECKCEADKQDSDDASGVIDFPTTTQGKCIFHLSYFTQLLFCMNPSLQ